MDSIPCPDIDRMWIDYRLLWLIEGSPLILFMYSAFSSISYYSLSAGATKVFINFFSNSTGSNYFREGTWVIDPLYSDSGFSLVLTKAIYFLTSDISFLLTLRCGDLKPFLADVFSLYFDGGRFSISPTI
jgi:hypothetical protein